MSLNELWREQHLTSWLGVGRMKLWKYRNIALHPQTISNCGLIWAGVCARTSSTICTNNPHAVPSSDAVGLHWDMAHLHHPNPLWQGRGESWQRREVKSSIFNSPIEGKLERIWTERSIFTGGCYFVWLTKRARVTGSCYTLLVSFVTFL